MRGGELEAAVTDLDEERRRGREEWCDLDERANQLFARLPAERQRDRSVAEIVDRIERTRLLQPVDDHVRITDDRDLRPDRAAHWLELIRGTRVPKHDDTNAAFVADDEVPVELLTLARDREPKPGDASELGEPIEPVLHGHVGIVRDRRQERALDLVVRGRIHALEVEVRAENSIVNRHGITISRVVDLRIASRCCAAHQSWALRQYVSREPASSG